MRDAALGLAAKARDDGYLDQLQGVAFRPIFIMGDHRSGTTLFYEILGATGCFHIVTAYQIICAPELVYNHLHGLTAARQQELAALFAARRLQDRGFDRVQAHPEMPEEYGFILERGGYRPRLQPQNLASFITFCRKVVFAAESRRPILLKNPWDFTNFLYMHSVFPEARFLFIHRHPLSVIDSQVQATRALFASRNEYVSLVVEWYRALYRQPVRLALARLFSSSFLDLGLRTAVRHVRRTTSAYLAQIPQLPAASYRTVRYEDLCANPQPIVAELLTWLGVTAASTVDYRAMVHLRQRPLSPVVARHGDAILRQLHAYLVHCGYGAGFPPKRELDGNSP